MAVQWGVSRGKCTPSQVTAFESKYKITFPAEYKKLVATNNGSRPDKDIINLGATRGVVVFDALINWDTERPANIYFWMESLQLNRIIPFGKDPFGNLFCFDYQGVKEPSIIFWDHETGNTFPLSSSWTEFTKALRK